MSAESQIKVLENVVERIDTSIEKLTEVSNSIGKLLAVHDERINTLEKGYDRATDEIKDLHSRITTISREICDKLDQIEDSLEKRIRTHSDNSEKLHKELKAELEVKLRSLDSRINLLETWRWVIVGGAVVLGYIADKLTNLFN
jgi:chromosome segregation ATPase